MTPTGLMLSWLLLVKQTIDCEKLCVTPGSCAVEDSMYSLGDMSYVPYYRRYKRPLKSDQDEPFFGQKSELNDEEDKQRRENEQLPRKSEYTEDHEIINEKQSYADTVSSDENAERFSDFMATLELLREFSRGIRSAEEEEHHEGEHEEKGHGDEDEDEDDDGHGHGDEDEDEDEDEHEDGHSDEDEDEDEDEHGHGHHHGNTTEERACNNVELSWDEHCYFLTKKPIPGYRSVTACSRTFTHAEFAEIENDVINSKVSEYIRRLDKTSGRLLKQRALYVYIKDDHEGDYRSTRMNSAEEEFKKSICDMVGCQCTALRSTTGTWHSRICDTRHYALCKRPHEHPKPPVSTELPVTDVFDKKKTSAGMPSVPVQVIIVVMAALSMAL